MSVFKDLVKNIGYGLEDYAKGAWNVFLQQASQELTGLSGYYVIGTKKTSILNSNLDYIQKSAESVRGVSGEGVEFTYYGKDGGASTVNAGYAKPLLADPSNDRGADYGKDGEPRFSAGSPTYGTVNAKTYSLEYGEYEAGAYNEVGAGYSGTPFADYEFIQDGQSSPLVNKTNRWFKAARSGYIKDRFSTIISRFHTDTSSESLEALDGSMASTAYSNRYGLSHGRNLLKVEPDGSMGYDNPYCRVWTWHHQYGQYVRDTIRPLTQDGAAITQESLFGENNWDAFRSDGHNRLREYGAMFDNAGKTYGLVNITPSWRKGSYRNHENVSVEHCMFSIENLAWKGHTDDLSEEQKGPLGGRIMWFPPYDISIQESSNARWDENVFIGRGEPMYTYSNTSRNGSLHFKLLIDHPAILDYWEHRDDKGNDGSGDVDEIDSNEQTLLRFFAGCEVLKASDPRITQDGIVRETPDKNTNGLPGRAGGNGSGQPGDRNGKDNKKEEPAKNEKRFNFLVFYPNNYSGKSDRGGGNVNPIDYLLNGVGAQMCYDSSQPTVPQSFGVDMTVHPKYERRNVGGYEMRSGTGISLVTSHTPTNIIADVTVGGKEYSLMKQFDVARKKGTPSSSDGMTDKERENWNKGRWYYRVDTDDDVINQELTNVKDSYIDKTSYQFNSINYIEGVKYFDLKDPTYSLTEMYVALNGDKYGVFSGLYSDDSVEEIKAIVSGRKGRITRVVSKGRASSQANNQSERVNERRNNTLGQNRAETALDWFMKGLKEMEVEGSAIEFNYDRTRDHEQHDSNDKDAKMNRVAIVEVYYVTDEDVDASQTDVSIGPDGQVENFSSVLTNESAGSLDAEKVDSAEMATRLLKRGRYDDEARFFDKLVENDPFMTKLICEKVRYFNPVFHSMSPEGFNARLTFLNQCMRQGPTISGSDTGGDNPNNLSFGRPPVCVLRIGDFFNTKIIVTTLNITYDPLTWDLNHEGIGVMPMLADVTLSFNFVGGSDLGGPIQRLQNALSFNYYANAGVYDNRADSIDYSDGGEAITTNDKSQEER